MKIKYLDCDGKAKLFSFSQHDYKTLEIDNKHYMIDGGIDSGYIRTSENGTLEEGDIKDLIVDIRESFVWVQNYDKNNNRLSETKKAFLKDLTSSHICGILSYFTNRLEMSKFTATKEWCVIHDIFIWELDYRINNNLV